RSILRSERESPFIDSARETLWVSLGIANQPLPTSPGCRIRLSASAVTNNAEGLVGVDVVAVELVPPHPAARTKQTTKPRNLVPACIALQSAPARPFFRPPTA